MSETLDKKKEGYSKPLPHIIVRKMNKLLTYKINKFRQIGIKGNFGIVGHNVGELGQMARLQQTLT
jgi:hypothetical protein